MADAAVLIFFVFLVEWFFLLSVVLISFLIALGRHSAKSGGCSVVLFYIFSLQHVHMHSRVHMHACTSTQ